MTETATGRTMHPYGPESGTSRTMKAIVQVAYGAPDVLTLREIDVPIIQDDEVLVKVEAASLHRGDCFVMRGSPFVVRLMTGLLRPKSGVPGFDLAGQVLAVGKRVTRFRPGDEVFGSTEGTDAAGSCAEVAKAKEDCLALKPANLTMEGAATMATSGLAALHGLRDIGRLGARQHVLINGASGGVGTFAVQIAKALGAEVTGVCSTANVELVRSLGADHVVDYTQEDFTQRAGRYDLILDNLENRALSECRRALTPDGTLVLNSGTGATGMALWIRLLRPLVVAPFARQRLCRFVSTPTHEDLCVLKAFAEAGKLKPVIDQTFPLAETPDALRHLEGGHARGKVVITL